MRHAGGGGRGGVTSADTLYKYSATHWINLFVPTSKHALMKTDFLLMFPKEFEFKFQSVEVGLL